MNDGTEPIAPNELLYRRISFALYDPERDSAASPRAFRPNEKDTTGLSLYRAKYHTPEEIAPAIAKHPYWVGILRAKDILRDGMSLVPRPMPPQFIGHAEITDLTYECRRTRHAESLQMILVEKLCKEILGPFDHHL